MHKGFPVRKGRDGIGGLAALAFGLFAWLRREALRFFGLPPKRFPRGAWEFGHHEVVRLAEKGSDFRRWEGFGRFDGDPFGASEIGSGDDPRTFRKFREFFRVGLQGEPNASG